MAERPRTLLSRLLLTLLPSLLFFGGLGAVVDYQQVQELADVAYDQALANVALGLAARLESDHDNDLPLHLTLLAAGTGGRRFLVQAGDGHLLAGDQRLTSLLGPAAASGPSRVGPAAAPSPVVQDLLLDGQRLRVAQYAYSGPDGSARILVAEPTQGRIDSVAHALRSVIWSNLGMALAVVATVTLGVRKALAPLDRLAQQVAAHHADRLHSLEALDASAAPAEVQPLVNEVNLLMHRLGRAQAAEQSFLNACAHQLRTPLAALRAQLDVVLGGEQTPDPPQRQQVQALQPLVQRLTRLSEQMLALARAEAGQAQAADAAPVDLEPLLQGLANEYLDRALGQGVELALECQPAQVRGQGWLLHEMAANLLDNALRHAPRGSEVVLRCHVAGAETRLEVEDVGPGISAAHRERVFEPFVRLNQADRAGSGLGLAIVREVASQHGARVDILSGAGLRGTCVRVSFA